MGSIYKVVSRAFRGRPFRFITLAIVTLYVVCVLTVMISESLPFPRAVLVLIPSMFGELGDVEAKPADVAAVLSLALYVLILAIVFEKVGEMVGVDVLSSAMLRTRISYRSSLLESSILYPWVLLGQHQNWGLSEPQDERRGSLFIAWAVLGIKAA